MGKTRLDLVLTGFGCRGGVGGLESCAVMDGGRSLRRYGLEVRDLDVRRCLRDA